MGTSTAVTSSHSERRPFQTTLHSFSQNTGFIWRTLTEKLKSACSFLLGLWFIKGPYIYIARLIRNCSGISRRSLSVSPKMDLMTYCDFEWKGGTPHAEKIKKAYQEIYDKYHIKYVHQIRGDNYCALRATMFQVLSRGVPFPFWMREQDITKVPEMLFYKQGCNWIQQYSFGPEKYAGPKVFYKLRQCMDMLKMQWGEMYRLKEKKDREKACKMLFSDESMEYKIYEAVKFLMLYLAIEMFEGINQGQDVPNFCRMLFARDTSLDPVSFMLNHLNCIGDTGGLEQIEMFLLGYTLKLKIRALRLSKYGTEEFESSFVDVDQRDWHSITLLTEDDRHYNIPIMDK
ncbi:inactive ubiquitin thioesterase OTULINL-like [Erpetoichthys calabaricus]|uniref:OTU deubiquitinase with linear linkage specificity like n=1 Tax=Erpetoichthys calabaricus TaxID=27687 RepID=A0A8C4RSE6_ERPCA|nr:inactive ubiquitin thioesterase OTULINL-like [Erpetoichthys calabaricus]